LEQADALDPSERLERYFDLFRVLHGKGERMCPGGSFGAVFGAVSSPVQRALHAFTKMHLDWLEGVVREGVERGQFSIGEQRPRDVAVQIFASVQGALLTGRLTSDPHVIDQIAAELRSYLGYARPAPVAPKEKFAST
jgi:TetR/AcrR family transcriptional repressor of nem operon